MTLLKLLTFLFISTTLISSTTVTISGRKILVNGKQFFMRGVCYYPVPIGLDPDAKHDYMTSEDKELWTRDLNNLREMGANTIRMYGWDNNNNHDEFMDYAYNNGVDPIYLIIQYYIPGGLDISDPTVRQNIKNGFVQMVNNYKHHDAVLMWMIGNELNAPWNYGDKLNDLFSLIEEIAEAAHQAEGSNYHPVSTPLMDNDLIHQISTYNVQVPNLDIWSVQLYRGISFGDFFEKYAPVSGKPLLVTEYGIDAFDDRVQKEDQSLQRDYGIALSKELSAQGDVCSGGSIFSYVDEWWKGRTTQTDANHPDCPENNPSYQSNCGFPSSGPDQYSNEEWFGIFSTKKDGSGIDILTPRLVYHELKAFWKNETESPKPSMPQKSDDNSASCRDFVFGLCIAILVLL